jgi:hypothetical protein
VVDGTASPGREHRIAGLLRFQHATGTTDAKGAFMTRGFKGQCEMVVKAGDRTRTVKGVLSDGGSRIDVKI